MLQPYAAAAAQKVALRPKSQPLSNPTARFYSYAESHMYNTAPVKALLFDCHKTAVITDSPQAREKVH